MQKLGKNMQRRLCLLKSMIVARLVTCCYVTRSQGVSILKKISWHYGHWAYGSIDVVVDGKLIPGDSRRGTGIVPNSLMLEDTVIGNVCLTDPIGVSTSFF